MPAIDACLALRSTICGNFVIFRVYKNGSGLSHASGHAKCSAIRTWRRIMHSSCVFLLSLMWTQFWELTTQDLLLQLRDNSDLALPNDCNEEGTDGLAKYTNVS